MNCITVKGKRVCCPTQRKGQRSLSCDMSKRITFTPGKSNHAAKVRRGKALHRKFRCTRNKRTGQFTDCEPR